MGGGEAILSRMADIGIVIPVFNQVRYTRMCLDSMRDAGVSDDCIIAVDNGSTDETGAFLASRPRIRVLRNETNRGCGAAWTQGSQAAAPAKWTVVLNNDVLIPPGWLEGLVSFAEHGNFHVVSPAMCNGEADYDVAAHARDFMARMAAVRRRGVASGVCFIVHRRVFDASGYFDDDPRLGGYEDDEFFRRCRAAGFRLAITGRAFLHHFGSMTQNAMKAEIQQPESSLGDRAYYRQKYGLTWHKRQRGRWRERILAAWWRASERLRHGRTLISDRRDGAFVWR
jgi:N-acetylglucosaminyl-diphospho-decaprenol L-rhamnosyltransferase